VRKITLDQAIRLYGSKKEVAEALGISKQYLNGWGNQLTQRQSDAVLGSAVRLGKLEQLTLISKEDQKRSAGQ